MFILYLIAAFILLRRLRKNVQPIQVNQKWSNLLNIASWSLILVIPIVSKASDPVQELIAIAVLSGVLIYLDRESDFTAFDSYMFAHYSLVGLGIISALVELVFSDFYDKYDDFFAVSVVAAFVWVFARWAASKKQLDELKMATAQNNELEALVAERTAELTKQKNELQATVEELKNTQAQLIQAEKMASLGELTAGIAHEIQNPLNFVNNFSEVSMELLQEMEEELARGDMEEVVAIANDVKQNLEKIGYHGRRADGIVKGMLQHSRASTGQKELLDINALADEYFRLSYHGLRAKDKSFNANLVTKLNPDIPQIYVIQQDLGRVILNLFNNAFYAVHQRQKASGSDYKPTVEVSTGIFNNCVEIRIKDNGTGIPDAIKEKIMQPFFTTKPTGEGTGLGLSLSYDIIVKGHNGSIEINSEVNNYTEFVIKLPINNS